MPVLQRCNAAVGLTLLLRATPPPCKIRTELICVRPFKRKLQSINANESLEEEWCTL
jgi:hypothetical protein